MNRLNLGVELLIILGCSLSQINAQDFVYRKGANENTDTQLPCNANETVPIEDRYAIWWWKTNGTDIGFYTKQDGFQPSHPQLPRKFDMFSLVGSLTVYGLNKAVDDVVYNCGITTLNGTNITHTQPVKLEIGNYPHNFNIYTNGIYNKGCYKHEGQGEITCSIVSDPPATIRWKLDQDVINIGDECQRAVDKKETICVDKPGDQYECSYTFNPYYGCYGIYTCEVQYKLGDDIAKDMDGCAKYIDGSWPLAALIWAWCLFVLLIIIIIVIIILLFSCGVVGCTLSLCNKKTITPYQSDSAQAVGGLNSDTVLYTTKDVDQVNSNDNITYDDDPPPYSAL